MDVIPVLDVRGGRALHARRGERARYQVVDGVLGRGDDPLALARAFRDRLGLHRVYLADLDAIARSHETSADETTLDETTPDEAATPHEAVSHDATPLLASLADLRLEPWIDAGTRTLAAARALVRGGAARVVLAQETLPRLDLLRAAVAELGAAHTAFSLDLRAGRPLAADPSLAGLDPLQIAGAAAAAGIDTILVIDLAAVGAESGLDDALLGRLREALPHVRLVAGGGIRDAADLERLAAIGCDGALVATALHRGRIGRAELERLAAVAPASTSRSAP